MATFNNKERFLAKLLTVTPALKKNLKYTYIYINSVIYKKNYNIRVLSDRLKLITDNGDPSTDSMEYEIFGGYYDIPTLNKNGDLLSHHPSQITSKIPTAEKKVEIVIRNIYSGKFENLAESLAYNWQQGARLYWINDDEFIYNDFDEKNKSYKSILFSMSAKKCVMEYELPVQASYKKDYFLSINYRRLMNLRPDYGYRNLPLLEENEITNLKDDGIWITNFKMAKSKLLFSLDDIVKTNYKTLFKHCTHKVNHLIIKPNGEGFMFIHRYYQGKRRFDRLLYSDFKTIKVLADEDYVSHCCWVDNEMILGYLRNDGVNGYFYVDLNNNTIKICSTLTNLGLGDGHPSCFGEWIVFDSYPDKSRMQHLLLYNRKRDKIYPLLELYQSPKFKEQTRCDLHPRFSTDGKYISFDTVYSGMRNQCVLNVSEFTL